MIFAVTDIETTGGAPSNGSITEVAVILTDGNEILREFQSLVNPRKIIPNYITVLTGITNEMVEEAPFFEDIAEELLEVFKDTIFVAHNVNFDYSFIKAGFENYGHTFNMSKLCTVRYTRKMFPGISSYSLGSLSSYFNLDNDNPHRAMNDTMMAQQLLNLALQKDEDKSVLNDFLKRGNGDSFLPMNLNKETYHKLPEAPGVYYFRNTTGKVIYVGKAKNIKKRVRQHFSGKMASVKTQDMMKEIVEIDFELTGTELIAALKEDREIKHLWPKYNSAQKNSKRKFGIFEYKDRLGRIRLAVQNTTGNTRPLIAFSSAFSARQWLFDFREKYELPFGRLGLPYVDEEEENEPEVTSELIATALAEYKGERTSFLIKNKGRSDEEDSVILIEDNAYKGFGFLNKEIQIESYQELENHIEVMSHSDFSMSVICLFLSKNTAGEVIYLT